MKSRLSLLVLVVVSVFAAVVPSAAAPLSSPCAAGVAYDPACDVDHDGDVDIFDIQLAAGHWNQTGIFTSDNNHTHLGQGWAGVGGDPLTISGSFPTTNANAPLVLGNSSPNGIGLRIETTGNHGIRIDSAGANGLRINSALADGVAVGSAGSDGVQIAAASDDGFDIVSAGNDGLFVGQANDDGVHIDAASDDGVHVGTVGNPTAQASSVYKSGFEVAGAEDNGLSVGHADLYGVMVGTATTGLYVSSPSGQGVHVNSAGNIGYFAGTVGGAGFRVDSAGDDGVLVIDAGENGVSVLQAGADGVSASGDQFAGYFYGNIGVAGNCIGCLQANFGLNAGDRPLQPGDVVRVLDVSPTDFDTGLALWQVTLAQPGQTVAGVVAGTAELIVQEEHRPTESGKRLVPRDGVAQPGEYLTIVYSGPMQVKVASGESAIVAGTRLTATADGAVRPLGTIKVQLADGGGTADMLESAPVLGVALEAATKSRSEAEWNDGMLWVLVNPQ